MFFIKFFSLALILTLFANPSPEWSLSKEMISKGKGKIQKLTWAKGKRKMVYLPSELPFGMVKEVTQDIAGKKVWITMWPKNGQSVTYRIFDPDIRNTPLCEVDSFSDETRLRIKKKALEIEVLPKFSTPGSTKSAKVKKQWVTCRKSIKK